jgi:hypothetical protein
VSARAWADAVSGFWSSRPLIVLVERLGASTDALLGEATAAGAQVLGVVAGGGRAPVGPLPVFQALGDRGFDRAAFSHALALPSDGLREWLAKVDPDGSALVLATNQTEVAELSGRRVYGRRLPAWAAWEDKTRIDELWAQAGITAAPYRVVPLDQDQVLTAAREVDAGLGVVLAMDSSTDYRGDSLGLSWVCRDDQLRETVRGWHGLTRVVRVAPFLAGVPYSVLGLVTGSGVAVFDPIEIVTLRRPNRRFVFCGSSTAWRPAAEVAGTIREQALRAGRLLAGRSGYRGMFSVDGISTADGCFPTELNPRHASGLGLRAAWPDFPVYLVNRAVQEQLPTLDGLDTQEFERQVRQVVATRPSLSVRLPLPPSAPVRDVTQTSVELAGVTHSVSWEATPGALTVHRITGGSTADAVAGPVLAELARGFGLPYRSHDTPPSPAGSLILGSGS